MGISGEILPPSRNVSGRETVLVSPGQLKASEAKVEELTEASEKAATQNAGQTKIKEARRPMVGSKDLEDGLPVKKAIKTPFGQ